MWAAQTEAKHLIQLGKLIKDNEEKAEAKEQAAAPPPPVETQSPLAINSGK